MKLYIKDLPKVGGTCDRQAQMANDWMGLGGSAEMRPTGLIADWTQDGVGG